MTENIYGQIKNKGTPEHGWETTGSPLVEAKRIASFLRQRLAVLDYPRTTGKALTSLHSAHTGATASATIESSPTY
ncbi:MAG: hypothetical protein ACYCY1_03360 [Sulfuriferula sp.]